MIPAAGTRFQREVGIEEGPADMARDILEKNGHEADEELVRHLCENSVDLIHWLVDDWDLSISWTTLNTPNTPSTGCTRRRGGTASISSPRCAIGSKRENAELLTNTPVTKLVAKDGAVEGVVAGSVREEAIRAEKVILATDGFAGNREMVRAYCGADIADALYYGSDGNTGDGIRWGAELGGALASMDAFQGHATVVSGTGALSTYAVVMNGGILVNADGERFGNESKGYSEFAVDVVRQPDGVAYGSSTSASSSDFKARVRRLRPARSNSARTPAPTPSRNSPRNSAVPGGDPGRGRVVQRGRRRGRTRRGRAGRRPQRPLPAVLRDRGHRLAVPHAGRAGRRRTRAGAPGGRVDRRRALRRGGTATGISGHGGRRLPLRERAHDRHGARPARRSARRPVAGGDDGADRRRDRPEPAFAGETVPITGTAGGSAAPVRFASPSAARRWSAATASISRRRRGPVRISRGVRAGGCRRDRPRSGRSAGRARGRHRTRRRGRQRGGNRRARAARDPRRRAVGAIGGGQPHRAVPDRPRRAPHLRKTGGAVVNISSIYGQIGAAERAGYASTKAGIEGLTRALAAELGRTGSEPTPSRRDSSRRR